MTTNTSSVNALESAAPADAPHGPRQRQFRVWHAMFALGLMLVGALGSAALVRVASAEGRYLALSRDISYAAQLSEADLTTVRVDSPPGLQPVGAADLPQVVGTYAATPLHQGTLLTVGMLTADPVPGPGEHVVGLTLRVDRLPAQRPEPGESVLLVSTAVDDGQVAPTWTATVAAVAGGGGGLLRPGGSREVTLDVVVRVADGPPIARAAAAGELVVVRTAGR